MKLWLKNQDILVLPETFNTGFFPTDNLEELADKEGQTTKKLFSEYAKKHSVNIVAGSVTTLKNNKVFNTAYIFDKHGKLVAEYDKIHGFTPSGEHNYYQGGNKLVTFNLAGMKCGIIICYDIRFCELVRSLALKGIELLFIPAHWPLIRKNHWINLAQRVPSKIRCMYVQSTLVVKQAIPFLVVIHY